MKKWIQFYDEKKKTLLGDISLIIPDQRFSVNTIIERVHNKYFSISEKAKYFKVYLDLYAQTNLIKIKR